MQKIKAQYVTFSSSNLPKRLGGFGVNAVKTSTSHCNHFDSTHRQNPHYFSVSCVIYEEADSLVSGWFNAISNIDTVF